VVVVVDVLDVEGAAGVVPDGAAGGGEGGIEVVDDVVAIVDGGALVVATVDGGALVVVATGRDAAVGSEARTEAPATSATKAPISPSRSGQSATFEVLRLARSRSRSPTTARYRVVCSQSARVAPARPV